MYVVECQSFCGSEVTRKKCLHGWKWRGTRTPVRRQCLGLQ